MGNIKNIDEYFDPEILEALKSLGLVPPQTYKDYIKFEQRIMEEKLQKPPSLMDPFIFLERDPKKRHNEKFIPEIKNYEQNLAQAAREGKSIPDSIKKKMKEDKDNCSNTDGH